MLGAITFDSIDRYASRHGIRGANFDFYHRLLKALDAEYRRFRQER